MSFVDAGEIDDRRRDADPGVDERAPLLDDLPAFEQHDAHFDDAVMCCHAAGGLEVDAGDRAAQSGGVSAAADGCVIQWP